MPKKIVPHSVMLLLVVGLLILPVAGGVVAATAALLSAMGDATGGMVLRYVALGCGVLWVVNLAGLALAQGLNALVDDQQDERPEP